MKFHPLKEEVIEELHTRPILSASSTVQLSNLVVFQPGTEAEEIEHIQRLTEQFDAPGPTTGTGSYSQVLGDYEIRWERHTEFSAYTFLRHALSDSPFTTITLNSIPEDWLDQLSGEVIALTHLEIRPGNTEPGSEDELKPLFDGHSLIGTNLELGYAKIWTSVRSNSDGAMRLLIYDNGMTHAESGRLLRNLLELSAYRTLTFLALPTCRDLLPEITLMEHKLAKMTSKLAKLKGIDSEKKLLKNLTAISAKLEALIAANKFRFAATEAYYGLTIDRLRSLSETPLPHGRTLEKFHHRRFIPGFRTCKSVQERMEDLSHRIGRATDLLRTNIDLALESQNQKVLKSMNKRSQLQLRLQQTVEGLSVVAISYYALNLLALLLYAFPDFLLPHEYHKTIKGVATLPMVLLVWFGIRKLKSNIHHPES